MREWKTCSPLGARVLALAKRAADSSLSVFLSGETGVGKDVLAHAIHQWCGRRKGPFVPINCSNLPIGLAESELFGHVRGAFTGAEKARAGACIRADGGTLFLDEVADLPFEAQPKLLRFLEEGEIRALGSDKLTQSDVRIVSATHQRLASLVESGRFRRDLFFRLSPITIEIPPLRERPDDVVFLARDLALSFGKVLDSDAIKRLKFHHWPGNVRELKHAVERAALLASLDEPELSADDFSFLESHSQMETLEVPSFNLEAIERIVMMRALSRSRGHRGAAAQMLGVARSTFFEMLRRHGIERDLVGLEGLEPTTNPL